MTTGLHDVAARLEAALPGQVQTEVPLGSFTTWRVGGPAAVSVRIVRVEDFLALARELPDDVPRSVLGRGSNLLVADAGFPGVVITLGPEFETLELDERRVRAGGAVALPVLARRCAAEGLGGLGFYVGIPGSVGGAVRMNAGGHGQETSAVLIDAQVVDLGARGVPSRRPTASLDFGYRYSALGANHVVVEATFAVEPSAPETLRDEIGDVVRWRTEHQPGGANAGSVFRNPPGDSAARLIDQECGLRGVRIGGAVVSEKHANFIQAESGARASDVHDLILSVRDRVEQHTGVRLEIEVHELGFGPPTGPS